MGTLSLFAGRVARNSWNYFKGTSSSLEIKSMVRTVEAPLKLNSLGADTFVQTTTTNFASRIKQLSGSEGSSKTLQKLFSPEFAPARHIDENGYFVTTLMDKKTQKPVEVFVKKVREGKYEFYKKMSNNEYEFIGSRSFSIDKELGVMKPGFMANHSEGMYAGIGIRGHQLAVEEAIREGVDVIYLSSLPKAMKFHQKCLYRPLPKMKFRQEELEDYVADLAEKLSLSEEQVLKMFSINLDNGVQVLDLRKTTEQINKYLKQQGITDLIDHPTMNMFSLEGETLALWKDLVKSQPITL